MLINPVPAANISTFANPRQIAASIGTAGQVMYTVPAGKKFVGYIFASSGSGSYSVTPSGGVAATFISAPVTGTSIGTTPMQLTFVAGTIITNLGTSVTYLSGVESDL